MPTPFHDLDAFTALPRLGGLVLSPAGDRLVTAVATLDPAGTKRVTALWSVDPTGERPAQRLTHGAKGEQQPVFLPGGDLLFTSARPDPGAKEGDHEDDHQALWLLPAAGGEARLLATRPGGIAEVAVAREAGTVVVASPTLPGAASAEDDQQRRKQRKDRKVSAILHDGFPIRLWDRHLGPDQVRLLVAGDARSMGADARMELRDLTPSPGRALDEPGIAVAPDGSAVVTTWYVPAEGGRRRALAVIDLLTGERRLLADDPELDLEDPVFAPDGTRVALVAEQRYTPEEPPDRRVMVLDVATGALQEAAPGWNRWPNELAWSPDGTALWVTADEGGRGPVFRIDPQAGSVTRITADDGTYSDLQVAPDGRHLYALRAAVDAPPAPVRLDTAVPGSLPEPLRSPVEAPPLPGRLTEVTATAEDGAALRAWLVLPDGTSADHPAPLLLWIHGGPMTSWNSWHWRWNPWVMAAHGYAVLLPDPALSTGYGMDWLRRGWGRWGQATAPDLLAVTGAALAREDLDPERTAAMGGSFGGYMANWLAGTTDRFRAIVSHAGLWSLDQFGGTTDFALDWRREYSPEHEAASSPHQHRDRITTPMLVIHGDRDYRVPVGEALRLWTDLAERSLDPDGAMPHRFLYFPDEHHWVMQPNHSVLWYQTVLAFLAHHLRDEPFAVPDLLR